MVRTRGRHSRATKRDLARLADGTLDHERREHVEHSVAGSYELQLRLRDQRRAVAAVRAVATERAPLALRLRRRALTPAARPRLPLFALGIGGVLGALALTLAMLSGAQGGLTVAQAATLAARAPAARVAEPAQSADDSGKLPRISAAGLPFPYWEDRFGWVATGVRHDTLGGRTLTTVFYRFDGRRIAYTIVPGTRLPDAKGARTITRAGTVVHASTAGGRLILTWVRRGHTCVLSGAGVPLDALTALAAWRNHGKLPY
jgi:hypothetical protein